MKTFLAFAFGASFTATAAICAAAGEEPTTRMETPHASPASIARPVSAPAVTALRSTISPAETIAPRRVRVVLDSPYARS